MKIHSCAMSSDELKPLRIGVRFKQPAIVLLYEQRSKFRKRVMPIRGLTKSSPVSSLALGLKERHQEHLAQVPVFKIEKMLRLVQCDMRGMELERSLEELEPEYSVDPEQDLNGLEDAALRRKKEIMDEGFERNRKKPGDPDFQYDVEVDYSQVAGMESSVWDSEKEDEEF